MTSKPVWILGEALMDCVAQEGGLLRPLLGGSPYNLARAAALRGASTGYLNPLSTDRFGDQLAAQLAQDGVALLSPRSRLPTSLAVVQLNNGQPSYGFYREGIADRDYTPEQIAAQLRTAPTPGVLHVGSLVLVPPEHSKVLAVLRQAKALGWTISVDVNMRPKLAANLADYAQAVMQVAQLADWLKASDEDMEALGFGSANIATAAAFARRFADMGTTRIALTYGEHGAYLQVDGVFSSGPVPTVKVVDTVGAGDTFWGNCLGDWVLAPEGASERVSQTLRVAMQAAAINCTRAGCQPPSWGELEKVLSGQ
jgi:fructokinase